MPVWVPELDLLYVLVPRTGSTAMGVHLRKSYGGVDLSRTEAVDLGVVAANHHLRKHSGFDQVRVDFRPPGGWRRLVKVAGIRNPADSLFSSWWKHAVVYPAKLANGVRLSERDRLFIDDRRTRRRIDRMSQLSFSDWVLTALQEPPGAAKRVTARVAGAVQVELARRRGGGVPRADGGLCYEGADFYLRFEQLDHDWRELCLAKGWSHHGDVPLINETVGRPPDYAQHLTPEAAEHLRRVCARELKRFGYEIRSSADSGPEGSSE